MSRIIHFLNVASVAHAANREYCAVIGDAVPPEWLDAGEAQHEGMRKGVENLWDKAGRGEIFEPSANHESWLAHKKAEGWKWGAVKDEEKKEHPCFMPYDELPEEQRVKDQLFIAIVSALLGIKSGEINCPPVSAS